MKKFFSLVLGLLIFVSSTAQLKQIGTFKGANGEKFPLYLYGLVIQQTPDGKALVPRGSNFLRNGMVESDYQFIVDLLPSTSTNYDGLEQPDNVPCPDGYYVGYLYNSEYNIVSKLFVKGGETIEGVESKEQAFARVKSKEKKPPVSDWEIGQWRNVYGSRYSQYREELQNGEATFNFFGQNVNYPTYGSVSDPSTDELVVVALATHSIVNFSNQFLSFIEYKLIDENGKVVLHVKDTRGGWHPSQRASSRGNNHPDDANRWFKYGKYKLYVKNWSTDSRAVQSVYFGTIQGANLLNYDLQAGEEQTFDLSIDKLSNKFDFYKLNFNVFRL